MGFCGCIAKILVQAVIVFLLIVFIPGLPPDGMEFSSYSITPVSPLEGPLSLNSKLDNGERLFEGELKGPEGLAVYKDELYTGVSGGHLIKIKNNKIVPLLKFGKDCDDLWEEPKCGRILGIAIDQNGMLYAVDGYYGIFQVNLTSGVVEKLADKDEVIDGKPLKVGNGIAVDSAGLNIYWTISSTSHDLHDSVYALLGDGNGRLIKTNLKTKKHKVLADNLHFPNGVALSKDETFILIAETATARVMRYYLKGSKKGTLDVFIDGLPGLPDNVRRNSKGEFLIPLVKALEHDEVHLPFTLAPFPLLRKFIVRVAALFELSLKTLNDLYPTDYFEHAMHFMGHFDSTKMLPGSKRVTIVKTDTDGNIIESLHSTDGLLSDVSDVEYFHGAYYIGSFSSPFLGRVKISE